MTVIEPDADHPEFPWTRIRNGCFAAHVDGIDYTTEQIRAKSWNLNAHTLIQGRRVPLRTAWTPSFRLARINARLRHRRTLDTVPAVPPPAMIGPATLAALTLRAATLETLTEQGGFLVQYSARPDREWVRHATFSPCPGTAFELLETRVRADLAPGGALHLAMLEHTPDSPFTHR